MKIIFVVNWYQGFGLSGGDRIWVELVKGWQAKVQLLIVGPPEAKDLLLAHGLRDVKFVQSVPRASDHNLLSASSLVKNTLIKTFYGSCFFMRSRSLIKETDCIYSTSDFWPDFFPSFIAKMLNPKIKWIAGFYLTAPAPFSKESPYKGIHFLKGLLYFVIQLPAYLLIKLYSDTVFVTSQPDVSKFLTKKRLEREVVVVRGGVDTSLLEKYKDFRKEYESNKKYGACYYGRFHQQKGVLVILDIWKLVTKVKPDAILAMIGNGELENEVKKKIEELGLGDNVKLFGHMEDGEAKLKVFWQSKIVLHPATYDSGGMASAEVMLWGIPGVSFDLKSLKTYYPKGMLKTKMFDLYEFSENIIKLLDDSVLYERMSKEAFDLILSKWSWSERANYIFEQVFR